MKKIFKIFLEHSWQQLPKEIHIRKLSNGYVIFDTYVKDKKDLAEYLTLVLENPDAIVPTPEYFKKS